MRPWFPVCGKTYVVLGLARSGFSTLKWLLARGASVIAVDDNSSKVSEAEKVGAIVVPEIPWGQVAALIQSPGIPLGLPAPHSLTQEARQRQIPIIGDGDLLRAAHPDARFVGITGTNGKSTTTALVGHILKSCGVDAQVGGNIGTPMLDLPDAGTYVLELSSYQLELFGPLDLDVAAWMNISPDHLDRHGSLENYVAAKKRIFQTIHQKQTAVIGVDDAFSDSVWQEISKIQSTVPVSVTRPLDEGIYGQEGWLLDGFGRVLELSSLPTLKGTHNFQNAAIAYGVCRALGLAKDDIVDAMKTFPGLAHRQEWVRNLSGITFINDSKGTNADATAKALATFDKIYWIAGGKAKSDGIDSLASYFPKIVHTFLIGDAQDQFAATLEEKVPYTKSGTMENAVKDSFRQALADGANNPVILLSPACASFDQFQDFEHRGEVFCQLVQSLEA
ncbi:MAG: UDP-N-acetylmuramoyl-L-alanine--D-glutamate ligase [Alphaproteobacteria bacterium]|nr:UDP-N-acetylmuramoyl-L-alanine--D-glutamate ligase [Alphaproteobacteria bacterium]